MSRLAILLATFLVLQATPPVRVQVVSESDASGAMLTALNIYHRRIDAKKCQTYAAAQICGNVAHWSVNMKGVEQTLETIYGALRKETADVPGAGAKEQVSSRTILIRSEGGAPYEVVRRVVAACSDAGFKDVSFSSEPPEVLKDVVDDLQIELTWDVAAGAVVTKVGGAKVADDVALERLLAGRQAYALEHNKASARVVIDADKRVPWKDVVTVMNLCEKVGIKQIKFPFSEGK